MATRVRPTRLGVMVDEICYEALETDAGGVVENALDANPGFAGRLRRAGHAMDLAEAVALPERPPATRTVPQIKLWD